jgi:TRAP-type transport system small permease protein
MLESFITKLCAVILWATISVIFIILCTNTVLRYSTGIDLDWGNEVPELLFPWLVMSGVVLAGVHGGHITTTFLRDRFKPAHQRYLVIGVWAMVAVLYGILIVQTGKMLPLVHSEKSPILGVPGSITFGCVMLGMLGLFVLAVKDFVTAIKTPAAAVSSVSLPNVHF